MAGTSAPELASLPNLLNSAAPHTSHSFSAARRGHNLAMRLQCGRARLLCRYATQSLASMSQLPGISADNTPLLVDFMGFLRLSLSQQAPVRRALYCGLHAVLAADDACASTILNFLAPQLQAYIQCKVCGCDPSILLTVLYL